MILSTNDVTIRGVDRNETIIDGGGIRPYGITTTADGVRIQNLTARNTTFYGVLVTGLFDDEGPTAHGLDGYDLLDPESFPPVERFEIDHVTAHNNGLYGIYAFDSIHGVIKNSYASGSADSGFYVGQCRECDIVVIDNVAERNAVGFENANASDSLVIAGNRFNNNRVGMTLLSNYQEAFTPQRANVVVGNAISDNNEADSPAQADGGFGTGIGISGGHDNVLERNRVEGNSRAGLLLANTEDIPVLGTRMIDSLFGGNGVDVANISADRSPAMRNCVADATSVLPEALAAQLTEACDGVDAEQATLSEALPATDVPQGRSFLQVAYPKDQPSMARDETIPGPLPATAPQPDLTSYGLPDADLFLDLAGTR